MREWELNPGLLEEQPMFTPSSLSHYYIFFLKFKFLSSSVIIVTHAHICKYNLLSPFSVASIHMRLGLTTQEWMNYYIFVLGEY